MSLTRRRLFQQIGVRGGGPQAGSWISARGREHAAATGTAERGQMAGAAGTTRIDIDSNENPLGPGAHVLDAVAGVFDEAGRYPFNAVQTEGALIAALSTHFGVTAGNLSLGAGSGEILTNAVRAFTSADRPLVTAWPSFENPRDTARRIGTPVREVALDSSLRIDIDEVVEQSRGAGLVFFCNPNNPTATVHGAGAVQDMVSRIRGASPDTVILIDEAYHDYVTDPAYTSSVALAVQTPNVFVTRTFSKAYGMAGIRIGYAIGPTDTITALDRLRMPFSISVPGIVAGAAGLANQPHIEREVARNTAARAFTLQAFEQLGFEASDSQTNFIFVNLGRPAGPFRDACAAAGVMVGRDFPPYEQTHCRISIGTMAEMERAVGVFRQVLAPTTMASGQGGE